MATPYISMAGIGKSFGPVHALKSVNLTVYPGEIHALLGENGAGKSTPKLLAMARNWKKLSPVWIISICG